ncbi:hypothetical protein Mterra_02567 [Calidithermus terrae]|uniref:Uncharacterized protein n=1 Tax=Calidithermus terrae TaxID=1408545 RepID=A0A399EED7_9DEIN|nr:hypothetical protein Mterra_02567 [Calidithermus terrae]
MGVALEQPQPPGALEPLARAVAQQHVHVRGVQEVRELAHQQAHDLLLAAGAVEGLGQALDDLELAQAGLERRPLVLRGEQGGGLEGVEPGGLERLGGEGVLARAVVEVDVGGHLAADEQRQVEVGPDALHALVAQGVLGRAGVGLLERRRDAQGEVGPGGDARLAAPPGLLVAVPGDDAGLAELQPKHLGGVAVQGDHAVAVVAPHDDGPALRPRDHLHRRAQEGGPEFFLPVPGQRLQGFQKSGVSAGNTHRSEV